MVNLNKVKDFKGNVLTKNEKGYRLKQLEECDDVDKLFIPYLNELNKYNIMTTQCCTGHRRKVGKGYRRKGSRTYYTAGRAHIDFRSGFSPSRTIDKILRPMVDKYSVDVDLMLEDNKARYVIWYPNNIKWREYTKYLIKLVKAI